MHACNLHSNNNIKMERIEYMLFSAYHWKNTKIIIGFSKRLDTEKRVGFVGHDQFLFGYVQKKDGILLFWIEKRPWTIDWESTIQKVHDGSIESDNN